MGESWRNNHHAFPGSAKLGLYPGQADLGWVLIRTLEALGLAWDIVTPERLPPRVALRPAPPPWDRRRTANLAVSHHGAPQT